MKKEKNEGQEMQQNQGAQVQEGTEAQDSNVINLKVKNPNIIYVTIKNPIEINGIMTNELVMDFTDLTGKDIMKLDAELRMDGRPGGFDSIYNQDAMLLLAARGIGCVPDDLEELHGADFFEVLMQVRNFFIQW